MRLIVINLVMLARGVVENMFGMTNRLEKMRKKKRLYRHIQGERANSLLHNIILKRARSYGVAVMVVFHK